MNTWILVVIMLGNGGREFSHTVAMQEFNNQADCQYVANHITRFKGLRDASCFRKGETKLKEKNT
jgi:hypothetical protein